MKKSITIALAAIFYFAAIATAQDKPNVDEKVVTGGPTTIHYPALMPPKAPLPPPPPPPPPTCEIFEFVEQFPLFPGCNEIDGSYEEKKVCSDNETRKYLTGKAGYPAEAREAGIEGKIFIRFTVMPDGTISNIETAKDMTKGGGLAEACIKAAESMNELGKRWTPGMQKGKPVAVRMMMPFVFKVN